MSIVDWRELYASNQAAIRAATGAHPITANVPTATRPGGMPTAVAPLPQCFASVPAVRIPSRGRGHRSAQQLRTFTVGSTTRRALVHVPDGLAPETAVPLVCMLHGCTQDPASFAAATQMNEAADRHGFVVVYPEQQRSENPQGCWNWFLPEHQRRGAGEPAVLAGILQQLLAPDAGQAIDAGRLFVAGLSSGGAMAAILAATYPDLVAAVAVHSGLAYGSATTMPAAFTAMSSGAPEAAACGQAARRAMGSFARPVPSMVIHGSADHTVAPINARQVLEQTMTANRLASPDGWDVDAARPSSTSQDHPSDRYASTRQRWTGHRDTVLHELLIVEGLGHAWSGGVPGGSYTDPRGPDATEAIWSFFAQAAGA